MKEEIEKINTELELLTKKVIVESEGEDVLTIQLLGQCKQLFRDMGKTLVDIEAKYTTKSESGSS